MVRPVEYPKSSSIWNRFYELTQVPRPSKKEAKVIEYIVGVAKSKGLKFKQDAVKNVVIYVPATKGYENHETVIIQNHMDMVCDKTPEKVINFENDPIALKIVDGWVMGQDTTLGADNGIGVAAALAILDEDTPHPALELLFTVDEETGLHGALNLDASLLSGKKLINLDTEEWGSVYIGCAGGIDYELKRNYSSSKPTNGYVTAAIVAKGFKGGHSGVEIHSGRANAIKILADLLWSARILKYELAEFKGGKAHNIIPREAHAIVCLARDNWDALKELVQSKESELRQFMLPEDMNFELQVVESEELPESIFSEHDQEKFLNLITLFPHGPVSFNWQGTHPIVNYSNNLAIVHLSEGKLYINTSLRFFDRAQIMELEHRVEALAQSFNLELHPKSEYPSWKPDFDNKLIGLAEEVYRENFGGKLEIKAIHAGLECGILKSKLGKMDALSLGPNIKGAHSPTEALEISSTNHFWKFFKAILAKL